MLRALIDFTLSNARRFYSSMGNLLDRKGLRQDVSAATKKARAMCYDADVFNPLTFIEEAEREIDVKDKCGS